MWIRLESVDLGNGTDEYPFGDSVQAAVAWTPPTTEGALSYEEMDRALDRIGRGVGHGVRYIRVRRGTGANWVGNMLQTEFGLDAGPAKAVIDQLIHDGVVHEADNQIPEKSGKAQKNALFVNPKKRTNRLPFDHSDLDD